MALITQRESWPVDNQEVRMRKGKLVRIQIGPGQFRKMYEADAIEKGYIKQKDKPAEKNKMLPPQGDKIDKSKPASKSVEASVQPADDFSVIPGVGPATARILIANGISTFEQLREVQSLPFLPEKAVQAIDAFFQIKEDD